jgi:hypothetical protein
MKQTEGILQSAQQNLRNGHCEGMLAGLKSYL